MDMLNDTIQLLETTKGEISRRRMAADTGLGFEWINKLAQGRINDPGYKRIVTLHNYLSTKKAA